MRRLLVVLLVGLLALGATGTLTLQISTQRTSAALHDDHDDDDHGEHDDDRDDDSGRGRGRGRGGDDDATRIPAAHTRVATDTHEVHTSGERFQPATLTIRAGESVTFINDDDDEHTATGADFDTGEMNPGDAVTVAFDRPGTFTYICQFHADMQGEIIVLPVDGATPAASPAPSPIASPPASAEQVEVEIVNFAFTPASLTIRPGTTVVWTSTSPTPHTVTGDFADSGILESGDTFAWTFTDPGTFDYVCALHPDMQATIVVDPEAPPAGQ